MCYPNGGNEPTITDANLVLGRIPPALIGGGIRLDVERARAGLKDLTARLLANMSAEQIAEGIIEIANWNQANAIRQMTIQRGIDPRTFALLSFGGSGPAQSPAVMALIGMKACIVPPNPGNLSAFGLLAVDWRTDHLVTKVMHEDAVELPVVAGIYAKLESEAVTSLEQDGISRSRIKIVREADVRYAGQSMEVRVPAPSGEVGAAFIAGLVEAFHAVHLRTFGYNYAGQQKVELVNFCVSGFGMIDRPNIPKLESGASGVPPQCSGRPVYFDGNFQQTSVFQRSLLTAGVAIEGPAVIEEFGSTTVVFPGQHVDVDAHGILIVRAGRGTAEGRR
jgi:N-methylhydantoinase A